MIGLPNMGGWIVGWEAEREKLRDPNQVRMVSVIIEHSVLEAERDWDAVASTIHDDAVYRFSGYRPDRSFDKVAQLENYREIDSKSPGMIGRLEQQMEHFVVGDNAVAHDGDVYLICKGSELGQHDIQLPEECSADDEFLITWRMALFIPFKDGLIMAEDAYSGQASIVRRLSSEITRTKRAIGRIWSEG